MLVPRGRGFERARSAHVACWSLGVLRRRQRQLCHWRSQRLPEQRLPRLELARRGLQRLGRDDLPGPGHDHAPRVRGPQLQRHRRLLPARTPLSAPPPPARCARLRLLCVLFAGAVCCGVLCFECCFMLFVLCVGAWVCGCVGVLWRGTASLAGFAGHFICDVRFPCLRAWGQGESYEDLLCKGTGQRGVAILGDSAAAHFQYAPAPFCLPSMLFGVGLLLLHSGFVVAGSIPANYLTPKGWNLDQLLPVVSLRLSSPSPDVFVELGTNTVCMCFHPVVLGPRSGAFSGARYLFIFGLCWAGDRRSRCPRILTLARRWYLSAFCCCALHCASLLPSPNPCGSRQTGRSARGRPDGRTRPTARPRRCP